MGAVPSSIGMPVNQQIGTAQQVPGMVPVNQPLKMVAVPANQPIQQLPVPGLVPVNQSIGTIQQVAVPAMVPVNQPLKIVPANQPVNGTALLNTLFTNANAPLAGPPMNITYMTSAGSVVTYSSQLNTNVAGNDIQCLGGDPGQCFALCSLNKNCAGFVTNAQGGCCIKTKVTPTIGNSNGIVLYTKK